MLDTTAIGANPGFPLVLAQHRYSASEKGELLHYIDEQLRATVPPEGWDDYVKYWPQSIDVVRQLRAKAMVDQAAAQTALQNKLAAALATLPANIDQATRQAVATAVAAAVGIEAPRPAPAANLLEDAAVQQAIATLKAKGITISGA